MTKEKAHKYLTDKGCLSVSQTYTAFQVERMLVEFADQETESLKAEIEYLLTENKMLKQALDESDRKLIICEDTCDIHEQSLKELNELKEKHNIAMDLVDKVKNYQINKVTANELYKLADKILQKTHKINII